MRLDAAMPALVMQRSHVDLFGPLRELLVVLERNADDAADHLHRILRRDRRDQIRAAERRDRVEQRVDDRAHERGVPTVEHRRPERVRDEVAVLAVLLAVHREDEVAHVLADDLAVDRAGEGLPIAQHLLGVRVAGHVEARPRVEARALEADDLVVLTGRVPTWRRAGRSPIPPSLIGCA